METSTAGTDDTGKNKKRIYIIVGVIVLILIIVLIIVLAVVLSGKDSADSTSTELTASEKLDNLVSEIVSACDEKQSLVISGDYSCSNISESQREALTELFDEYNKDGDDKWSLTEFEAFFMDTGNENGLFDEMDTDDDDEIDFVEMMASLKKQSEITSDLFNITYNDEIYQLYGMSYNLSNWRWFAYAADLLFIQEFGDIYQGYPNGIKKADWMNISCSQEFDAYDDDDDNDDMIDLDEFIDKSFKGYGLMYFVVYTDIQSIYDASKVTEADLETIVDEINLSYDIWSDGLDEELSNSTNSNRRRLLGFGCNKHVTIGCTKSKCKEEGVQQSTACAGHDPSKGSGVKNGCGKSATGLISCLNEECQSRGYSESTCKNYVNSNV